MTALRHDCSKDGCFNEEHRLRFDVFSDCWWKRRGSKWEPGFNGASDIDFAREQCGQFLTMEWKDNGSVFAPKSGQGILFRLLVTRAPMTVILCEGSAREMTVRRFQVLHGRYDSGVVEAGMPGLKRVLTAWSRWAETHPAPEDLRWHVGVPEWLPEDWTTLVSTLPK